MGKPFRQAEEACLAVVQYLVILLYVRLRDEAKGDPGKSFGIN